MREGGWDGALCIWDVTTRKRKAVSRGREEGRDGGREAGSEGGRLGWCLVYLGRVHEEEESSELREGGREGRRAGGRE